MIVVNGDRISLTRGDTGIFSLELTDEGGQPFTPSANDKIRFAMAKKHGAQLEDILILKNVDPEELIIKIEPEDTKDLKFGTYVYDIEYTDAFGNVSTIIMGNFEVTKEVY